MKVCVFGLWHLGSVTAAALASGGHDVIGLDFDEATIAGLSVGKPPLFEPGLDELTASGISEGKLRFTTSPDKALLGADVLWVTFDTPVDDDDNADVDFVTSRVESLFDHLGHGTLVVLSSQLPVGSVRELERAYAARGRTEQVTFAASPENLRLGKAIEVFTRPDRVVAGIRSHADRARFSHLMAPFTSTIDWMTVESAEMTKHALNAFLAMSVAFANEIAVVCEGVGADAKEVERALKSDVRIGARAYLAPGGAFAGGTLARDISFLTALGERQGRELALIGSVKRSNDLHKNWARSRLGALFPDLVGKRIGVWGLTYKPGTDTLRRSTSIELCQWLVGRGALVQAHDPAIQSLPTGLAREIRMCATAEEAAHDVDALVVATEWPDYRAVAPAELAPGGSLVVIDANRFLDATFGCATGVRYVTVGRGVV